MLKTGIILAGPSFSYHVTFIHLVISIFHPQKMKFRKKFELAKKSYIETI
jgi:hypothetical protein